MPVGVESSIRNVETRWGKGDNLRLKFGYTVTLASASAVAAFRNTLQAHTTQAVLCPLWMAMRKEGESHPVSSGWYLVVQDAAPSAVYASGSVPTGLPSDAWIVPLMVGRFTEAPNPDTITTEGQHVEIRFTEASADVITLAAYSPTLNGPTVNGITPKVMPFRHQANTSPTGNGARVNIQRQVLGEARTSADLFYTQPSYRVESRAFVAVGNGVWEMLRWYQDSCRAPVWLPASTNDANLTANIGSGDTALPVDDASARGTNAFVLLDDGVNRAAAQVTGTSGSSWTLSGAIGTAFTALNTQIFNLQLARIAGGLSVNFWHTDLCELELNFIEIPWETSAQSFEVYGTTSGDVGLRAFLYTWTLTDPNGNTRVWRHTSFERDLIYSGNTYTGNKHVDWEVIEERLGLSASSVTVACAVDLTHPLTTMLPYYYVDFPMMLEIREVTVSGSNATSLTCWFYGEVVTEGSQVRGNIARVRAVSLGNLSETRIPRRMIQMADNWQLFDAGNGLLKTDFDYDATAGTFNGVAVPASITVTGLSLNGVSVPTLAADAFAGGMIHIINSGGADGFWKTIQRSTAVSGGQTTLTLTHRFPLFGFVVGSAVKIYPPYSGTYDDCISKFNNKARFGGFPFIPAGNPSMVKVSKNMTTGGKK